MINSTHSKHQYSTNTTSESTSKEASNKASKKTTKKAVKPRKFYTKNLGKHFSSDQLEILNKKLKKSPLTMDMLFSAYRRMYYRCYRENNHQSHPWNTNSTICAEQLNDSNHDDNGFYNFCIQYIDHYYEIEGEGSMHLDKDILVKNNRVYSPSTCCIVPPKINDMFGGSSKKADNGLPKGVSYSEKTGKYKPQISNIDGKQLTNIGWYETPEEAQKVYADHRRCLIIATADKYKDLIPDYVYKAIINYPIEITD